MGPRPLSHSVENEVLLVYLANNLYHLVRWSVKLGAEGAPEGGWKRWTIDAEPNFQLAAREVAELDVPTMMDLVAEWSGDNKELADKLVAKYGRADRLKTPAPV